MQSHAVLYHRYSQAMYHSALRIVLNPADAEDILQESFAEAFKNLEKLRDTRAFAGWIKKIVINRSIDFTRRKPRTRFVHEDAVLDELPLEEESFDEKVFASQAESMRQALNGLPDKYRLVMSLHVFEKMSFEQIAGLLSVPSATVRSQYLRGKQKIIEQLKTGKKI